MAASGLVDMTDAAAIEKAINMKVPLVRLIPMKAIFPQTLEKNGVRNGSDIAKCLEKLNSLIPPKDKTNTLVKTNSHAKNNGYFGRESFNSRLGRSPSTDSIVVSNFGSDQGSVDSCHYSSNGSDSNSVSSPSSPEEPDLCSRAGSPHSMPPSSPDLNFNDQNDDAVNQMDFEDKSTVQKICPLSGTTDCSTCGNCCETVSFSNKIPQSLFSKECDFGTSQITKPKENYLYQSKNFVPNSKCESFQNSVTHCNVKSDKIEECTLSTIKCDVKNYKFNSGSSQQIAVQPEFVSCNGTNQSNCSSTELHCNWMQCQAYVDGNAELVEHIRNQHVQVQMDKENFVCLWVGCKVYNKPSCSLSWLERHILQHGGNKPFKCIVDNCNQYFPTQAALQRHVNSHFDNSGHSNGSRNGRCRDEMGFKSFKRKKHLKYKRKHVNAKTEDFFDANIMEQIRYKLIDIHSDQLSPSTNDLRTTTFYSKVKAIRTEKSGNMKVLLHWIPENILPDLWVSEKSAIKYKRISYASLPPDIRTSLDSLPTNGATSNEPPRVKHRRK